MVRGPVPAAAPVLADLRDRGFDVEQSEDRTEPTAVATGGRLPKSDAAAPLAVEALAEPTPLVLVARLAAAAREGRRPLLVVDEADAEAALSVLRRPFLLRAQDEGRQFYAVPDRIQLTDGSYACVRSDGDLRWREEPTAESDDPTLLFAAGGEVAAVFESVAGLTCPGPEPTAFPYRYRREDKRFVVADADGPVGRYTSVGAMRDDGFQPVPLPLVPEHHVRENASLARDWTVAVVGDDGVTYERPGR